MTPQLFEDVLLFGRHLVATDDIDPIYPLLKEVIRSQRLSVPQAHWLIYLYLCTYNTATAWKFFLGYPTPSAARRHWAELVAWEQQHRPQLPLNIERRGLRGGKILAALKGYLDRDIGDPVAWLVSGLIDNMPVANYVVLWERLQQLPYVGRWAAFKWLDLLKHVLDVEVEAPDMRMQYCSGPRQALEELYPNAAEPARQDDVYIERLNHLGAQLRERLAERGLVLTWDRLETVLCNWHSLAHGRYYVGSDIDEHLHDTMAGFDTGTWLDARRKVLDHRLLGEIHGWKGVRRELKRLYVTTGTIYCALDDECVKAKLLLTT